MAGQNPVLSKSGMRLVRLLAAEGDRIFTTSRARELAPTAGISEGYLRQALHHLTQSNWLIRLRNGLYALSSAIPGVSDLHEFEIAMALVDPAAISHWSALHHHGMTEQAPRKVFVLTTTQTSLPRSRKKEQKNARAAFLVDGTPFQFVQVKPERFFGTARTWIGEARVNITDPERTLIDGLAMPQYFGDFAEVLHAFEAHAANLNLDKLIKYAHDWDVALAKRLGWVLENFQIRCAGIEQLRQIPIRGYRKLDPSGPRKGPCDNRWMIQENLPGKV